MSLPLSHDGLFVSEVHIRPLAVNSYEDANQGILIRIHCCFKELSTTLVSTQLQITTGEIIHQPTGPCRSFNFPLGRPANSKSLYKCERERESRRLKPAAGHANELAWFLRLHCDSEETSDPPPGNNSKSATSSNRSQADHEISEQLQNHST